MSIKIEGRIGQFINTSKPFNDGGVVTSFATGHKLYDSNDKDAKKYVNHNFEISSKLPNYDSLMKLVVSGNEVLITGFYKVKKGYKKNNGEEVAPSNVIEVKDIVLASKVGLQQNNTSNAVQQISTQEQEGTDDLPF